MANDQAHAEGRAADAGEDAAVGVVELTRLVAMAALDCCIAGCVSTAPENWAHSPDATTQTKRDIYECKADADGVSARSTAQGGAIMPIVGLFHRRSVFNECLESRGYKRAE